jgi:hypothetical protein
MGVKLRKKQVADRYGHTVRTIERWWKDPRYAVLGFPQPTFIVRNPLWDLEELEAWDRTRSHRPLTLDDLDLVPMEAAE